jgi:hypothetical protein
MNKTLRFIELVKTSGKPYVATLWTEARTDPILRKAIRENRVVTVRQENVGTKKDSGKLGFHQEKNVSYFVFPKPLPKIPDARVIGINYSLLEKSDVADPVETARATKNRLPPPVKTKRARKEFTATVRRTAVWETTLRLSAVTEAEAKKKAEQSLREQKLPMSEAIVKNEVRAIEG